MASLGVHVQVRCDPPVGVFLFRDGDELVCLDLDVGVPLGLQ